MSQQTVLVVEDMGSSRNIYCKILAQAGFRVVAADDYTHAIEQLQHGAVDLALLDIFLGGKSGLDILRYIRKHHPACACIMISAYADKKNAIEALREGAVDYLEKPADADELVHVMQHWASYSGLQKENARLRDYEAMSRSLVESQSKYRHLVENSPNIIYSFSDKRGGIYYSRQAEKILGYPLEHLYAHPFLWSESIHPDDRHRVVQAIQDFRAGHDFEVEYRVRRADGNWLWFFDRSIDRRQEGCEIIIDGVVEDITERKQAEMSLAASMDLLKAIVENAPIRVFWKDRKSRYLGCNSRFARDAGLDRPEEIIGKVDNQLAWKDQAELYRADDRQVMDTGAPKLGYEEPQTTPDGRTIWLRTSKVPLHAASGEIMGVLGIYEDITGRKTMEDELRLFSLVLKNSSEGMVVTDENNLIVAINPAFTRITGYSFDEVRGRNPNILSSGLHDEAFFQAMWRALHTTGQWHGEIWGRRKSGELYAKLLTINTVLDDDGRIYRHVALFSDITERKQSEELIWRQANFDPLTELPNRRMFRDRLEQDIVQSQRSGQQLPLLMIDLDKFKEVNDTLGHHMGDLLLKEAARRISGCLRVTDTVARLGGDEFAVALSHLEEANHAENIVQKILIHLAEPFQLGSEAIYASASIGIAMYPSDASDLESLMKCADQAMYLAKSQGRNRFCYFTQALQEAAQKRLYLGNDLRNALGGNQFQVYYQPIVDLKLGNIHKAEALIRWLHPVRGMVSPAEFIPVAEENGAIVEIGFWMFREACHQVMRWQKMFNEQFQVSVNRSPVEFQNDLRTDHVSCIAYIDELKLPGHSIVYEITEGLLLDARSGVTDILLKFRDAGFQVAIDDFGTGYSSLSYLKKFDIDYLKIDKSFVDNLPADANDIALCEAIIVMAHKLGLKVIAEGIETEEQRRILADAGCDYGQGYLFSPPVPADEFEKLPGL